MNLTLSYFLILGPKKRKIHYIKIIKNLTLLFILKLHRIFATESFPHLRLVFQEYHKLTGHDIESAIKREMSTSIQRAFLAVGKCYLRHKHFKH